LLIGVMVGATVTSIVNEHPDYIWLNVLLLVPQRYWPCNGRLIIVWRRQLQKQKPVLQNRDDYPANPRVALCDRSCALKPPTIGAASKGDVLRQRINDIPRHAFGAGEGT